MNHFYGIKKHEHVNEFLNQDSNCRFGYEILEENVTKKNAKEREVYYMIFFKTYDQKFGYNVNDPMMNIMTKNVNKGHKERKDYESYRNYVCLQTERKSSCAHA